MGALTIKNYAFEYRVWELESVIVTNFISIFPSTLKLQYKNKKLVRIVPEFHNEFLSNTVRFATKSKISLNTGKAKNKIIFMGSLNNNLSLIANMNNSYMQELKVNSKKKIKTFQFGKTKENHFGLGKDKKNARLLEILQLYRNQLVVNLTQTSLTNSLQMSYNYYERIKDNMIDCFGKINETTSIEWNVLLKKKI